MTRTKQAANIETRAPVIGKAQAALTIPGSMPYTINGDFPFYNSGKNFIPGYFEGNPKLGKYHDFLPIIRWFFKFDPIASTVVNRMADMSVTTLRNRKKTRLNNDAVEDATQAYYDALLQRLRPIIKQMALEYLLHGMAVPDYTLDRIRGDKLSEKLGRKRYTIPTNIWVRNPDNIVLKRRPIGIVRQVFLKIPKEDIELVQNKGVRSDGTIDKEAYQELVDNFPEYVRAIRAGKSEFELKDARPLLRKLVSYDEYPIPFLVNGLSALQHKAFLKQLDKSIASRAIEAIRHVKVGDKDFPATDGDIKATRETIEMNSSSGERVYNLITNHTITIEWIFPEMETLINEAKYAEPNADIFLAMGFPRVLTTGETLRSNSSDSKIASLGPKATLEDIRESIIEWLKALYEELADINNFSRIPEPYFAPIATSDYTALVQFAVEAMNAGAISKDTIAQLYGSDFETESGQILAEQESGVLSPTELQKQKDQEFQMEQTQQNQDFTREQTDTAHKNNLETIKATPKPQSGAK